MTALIIGVNGQDGAYLARHLLNQGRTVVGSSRNTKDNNFTNLVKLGIRERVKLIGLSTDDDSAVRHALKTIAPTEVYNLGGQSSVSKSFVEPAATFKSIVTGTLNILEGIRTACPNTRFYNAGSGDCFGSAADHLVSESTSFSPVSPYAAAKCSSHLLVKQYRESYGIHASTGFAFNHESPLRSSGFVTQKVVRSACAIAQKELDRLEMGDLTVARDWGWAPEYVEVMQLIMQHNIPEDFIIATGLTTTLQDFVNRVFSFYDLNWENYVVVDSSYLRPGELTKSYASPRKACEVLGWSAQKTVDDVITNMCKFELAARKIGQPPPGDPLYF